MSTRKLWQLISYPVLWLTCWTPSPPTLGEVTNNRSIKDRTKVAGRMQKCSPLYTLIHQSLKMTAKYLILVCLFICSFLKELVYCHTPSLLNMYYVITIFKISFLVLGKCKNGQDSIFILKNLQPNRGERYLQVYTQAIREGWMYAYS